MTDLTSTIIAAVGGDPTARTAGQTNTTAIAQLQALVQTLQAAVRTVAFTAATYSVNEGASGTTTLLEATMTRTGDLSAPLVVTTKFVAGTLEAADYASGSMPGDLNFTFAAGSPTAKAGDLIKGDDIVEPTETLTRYLVPPPGYSFGAITSYTGNVLNDDSATKVSINGTPPTTGTVGTAYSFTPTTANGSGTKTFALSGGPLLTGLAFSTSTGSISGTPTVAGSMPNLVVTVTDSTGSALTTATTVTIAAATATPVTYGPTVSADSGWQDLVGTNFYYRLAPAATGDSGTLDTGAELYFFCDTTDGSPTYGFKMVNVGGSRYPQLFYRDAGTWKLPQTSDATHDWGRALLKEDVIEGKMNNGALELYINGSLSKTFRASYIASVFPNGFGRFARYLKTGGTYTQKVTLSGGGQV